MSSVRSISATLTLATCLFFHVFWPSQAYPQAARISVDGLFSDWDGLSPLHIDIFGDQNSGLLDFGRLWCANDERFLFLRIEVGGERNIQNDNDITVYIDSDNSASTGSEVYGIGAELEWNFGRKTGFFVVDMESLVVSQRHVGVVTAPTVTSTQFEIAFDRNRQPDGETHLFPIDTIRIVFSDRGEGADLLPDGGTGVTYVFDNTPLQPVPRLTLRREDANHLRVLSYNVLSDGFFRPENEPMYNRILDAVTPEIIGFQEIFNHSADETANQVEQMLPSAGDQQWYSSKVDPDIVVVSRYPITSAHSVEGNGAFLLDLRPAYDTDLFLFVAHPPCCENNFGRQREVDAMMAFIRDAKSSGGVLDLIPNTPILIIGDLNLVGDSQQLRTLLTGEIVNTAEFGPSFAPDWDGSNFADLMPRQTDLLMTYTWYNESSVFSPGRLDFMIYSGSVMDVGNHFILFTPEMSADSLAAYGLEQSDVTMASDHLPVVSDFILPITTEVEVGGKSALPSRFSLHQNYPNPFNPVTNIRYELPQRSRVRVQIYDVLGQVVATLVDEDKESGRHEATWDGRSDNGRRVGSGVYVYRLQAMPIDRRQDGKFVGMKKLVLLR